MGRRDSDEAQVRVPAIISLRDIFLIGAAILSFAVSWGMYSTRISVVERELLDVKQDMVQLQHKIEDFDGKYQKHMLDDQSNKSQIEARIREVEVDYEKLREKVERLENEVRPGNK